METQKPSKMHTSKEAIKGKAVMIWLLFSDDPDPILKTGVQK